MGQCTVLLKEQKAPSQLNHSAAHSCVARLGEPFLSPFAAALVGCASETSIARYGSSIPQFPREDLVHQHVRSFDTNANHAGVTFSKRGSAVVLSTISVPGGSRYSLIIPEQKAAAAVNVALPRK